MSFCLCFYRCSLFAFLGQNPNVICLFREQKKPKPLTISYLDFHLVGITGLEPATSRPPDVCATNCAKSRSFANCECKGKKFIGYMQVFPTFFYFFCFSTDFQLEGNIINIVIGFARNKINS